MMMSMKMRQRSSSSSLMLPYRFLIASAILLNSLFSCHNVLAGKLVEVGTMSISSMEAYQEFITIPESFKCDSGRVCGLKLLKRANHSRSSIIDVDAMEGITLPAGTILAGSRTFNHPIYVDAGDKLPSRRQHVSFYHTWTERGDGFGSRPRSRTETLNCFMIKESMPGDFLVGTDYACIMRKPMFEVLDEFTWDGVIAAGTPVAIYRELHSAEQILEGTIIYDVDTGKDRMDRAVVAINDMGDWHMEPLSEWVQKIGPYGTIVSVIAGILFVSFKLKAIGLFITVTVFAVGCSWIAHFIAVWLQERGFGGKTVPYVPSPNSSKHNMSQPLDSNLITIVLSCLGGVLLLTVLGVLLMMIIRKKNGSSGNDYYSPGANSNPPPFAPQPNY